MKRGARVTPLLPGQYSTLGYRSATLERSSGRPMAKAGSADSHLRYDQALLGQMADAFDRDNAIYEGIVNRAVDAIIGTGFTLQAQTGNKSLNSRIEDDFSEWAEEPEVRGLFCWQDCEGMVLRSVINRGDVAAILTGEGKLQIVESERITSSGRNKSGNRVECGVEVDAVGRPVRFWIADVDESGYVRSSGAKPFLAKDVIFLANRKRFSQTRGVPVLVSAYPNIHRINDVCDSEAIAWQSLARFALTISRDNGPKLAFEQSGADPLDSGNETDHVNRVIDLEEAIIFNAKKGESLAGIDRNIPGANFPESVRMYLRLIGLPMGLPLEVILLDYSKTNYSSARAAMEQSYRMFIRWQRWLKRNWYTKVYKWLLKRGIEEGKYPDRPSTFWHDWMAPEFPWIDQLQEAQAWGTRMDRGLATQTQALKSINMDRDEYLVARKAEVEDAINLAKEINDAHPEAQVDWRMFVGLPVSKMQGVFGNKQTPANQDSQVNEGDQKQ